ncbi:MAG TPA: YceI family protein [Acidobacteriaceae bacterium]|nr:YceI family protein [Acidobacteriaceae bacterium]
MKSLGVILLVATAVASAHAQNQWTLTQSSITWHITHPVHEVEGTSHAAKGKGNCSAGTCDFLIAVPLNTFSSGDTNRDLHMLQTVRGAQFPMVVVRTHLPQSELTAPTVHADLEIQFAGQTAHYSNVPFTRTQHGADVEIAGTIPATCSDFKIDRPSFLTIPIHNEIPVKVDLTWHPQ